MQFFTKAFLFWKGGCALAQQYAEIIIDISTQALDRIFTYSVPVHLQDSVTVGCQVTIPFGASNRVRKGYVMGLKEEPGYDAAKVKEIVSIEQDASLVEGQLLKLASWMKEQYGSTLIQALMTVLPAKDRLSVKQERIFRLVPEREQIIEYIAECDRKHHVAKSRMLQALLQKPTMTKSELNQQFHITESTIRSLLQENIIAETKERTFRNPMEAETGVLPVHELNEEQRKAFHIFQQNYDAGDMRTYLLKGVTGSGKTEVYLAMIEHILKQKKQAIVLIPEIALTYQTVRRFANRFGDQVTLIHSRLSKGEKQDQLERARNGQVQVVIGPRSALFVPFQNLGLIIIDEEHEPSYKSETSPKYHTRETAIERARLAGASVVLGSATPSVESYQQALDGKYVLLSIKNRTAGSRLPAVQIVDMRRELAQHNFSMFSDPLRNLIKRGLERREQSILFINRRGYASFVSCRKCGYVVKCSHCDVSLKLHGKDTLKCHYCGYEARTPKVCPECGSNYIRSFGTGTEKVEEQLKKEFPHARIMRMDADTTRKKGSHEQLVRAFANQEADILVGTQMIVKGHDFANVTLVGALAADLSLFEHDFRSSERTFDLLTQAAGRAGRGDKEGNVVIQTYQPEQYSIVTAASQNYEHFFSQEASYRKLMKYPPYSHMLAIFMAAIKESELQLEADRIAKRIQQSAPSDLAVIGPSEASVYKVNDFYRKVIYLKHTDYQQLVYQKNLLEQYIHSEQFMTKTRIYFDFNPMTMY